MITNLSTAPVKCSHCTLFNETNTVHMTKNGAIQLHCKYLENSMTELSGSMADIFLLTYSLSSALMTSQFTSISELKQAIVSAWQQLLQAFTDKSINEWRRRLECVWYSRMGAISNICLTTNLINCDFQKFPDWRKWYYIVNAFYLVLASITWKLSAFTRYSGYILQVRWINL